jgi:hypothetical protein
LIVAANLQDASRADGKSDCYIFKAEARQPRPSREMWSHLSNKGWLYRNRTGDTMKYNFKLYIVLAFTALIIVVGAYSATKWDSTRNRGGFDVYYTAAWLVRSNQSPHLYD